MEFDSRQVPGGDLWQIFVTDPNGVMVELNYEAAKEGGVAAPRRAPRMTSERGSLLRVCQRSNGVDPSSDETRQSGKPLHIRT